MKNSHHLYGILFFTIISVINLCSCTKNNSEKIDIYMQQTGGVYQIPCKVNGVPMNFIFDTGASNVCISLTEALYLYKNGYIVDSDLGNKSYSQVADGSIVENMQLNLRTIEIEGLVLNNVEAIVVSSLNAPLLLGQTAIQRLGKIELNGNCLTIFTNNSHGSSNTHSSKDKKNDGWRYEYDYEVCKDRKFELYSKVINGNIEYAIKDTYLDYYYPVEKNRHFGDEKFDPINYKYKYVFDGREYFNIKGDDVEQELARIKAERWVFVREVYIYYIEKTRDGNHQCLEKEMANLYWRESDGRFKVVPCGKYSGQQLEYLSSYYDDELRKYKYHEPDSPRDIMVEEVLNYKYYEVHNLTEGWVEGYSAYTHKAGEYSFNL